MKDLSSVNKVVTGDQQTEVLNRLSTIKQVLSSNEIELDAGLRSQYSALANSFDEQGKLITNTANANGEVMRRGFDNANNLVLSAFDANGSLLNQQILDMNTVTVSQILDMNTFIVSQILDINTFTVSQILDVCVRFSQ